jgi:ribose-phosphate pyrophosphokinase
MKTTSEPPPAILAGSASQTVAAAVRALLNAPDIPTTRELLPDGEIHLSLAPVLRGRRVYAIQSVCSPVGERLLELALLADAAHRAGATRITAVVPYLGYSRHERRGGEGQPLGAAVVANLLAACRIDRLVTVDLHAPALEGFFRFPVEHLTAEPVLAEALRPLIGFDSVVVSPDLGAAKLARRFAQRLELPLAVVHKTRTGPSEVAAEQLVGEARGRRPIIVDDMISTGATIAAAREALLHAGAQPDFLVAATHGVFAPGWRRALAHPDIRRVLVTNSLEPPEDTEDERVQRVSVVRLLGEAIRRLHDDAPLGELLART